MSNFAISANVKRDPSPIATVVVEDVVAGSTKIPVMAITNIFAPRWIFIDQEPLAVVSVDSENGVVVVVGGGKNGGTLYAHSKESPVSDWVDWIQE